MIRIQYFAAREYTYISVQHNLYKLLKSIYIHLYYSLNWLYILLSKECLDSIYLFYIQIHIHILLMKKQRCGRIVKYHIVYFMCKRIRISFQFELAFHPLFSSILQIPSKLSQIIRFKPLINGLTQQWFSLRFVSVAIMHFVTLNY